MDTASKDEIKRKFTKLKKVKKNKHFSQTKLLKKNLYLVILKLEIN